MTFYMFISILVVSLILPFAVQLIKHGAITGKAAAWVAIILSVFAGVAVGLANGLPVDMHDWAAWLIIIFAAIGGTQSAYTAFKSVGFTSKWLDALSEIDTEQNDETDY